MSQQPFEPLILGVLVASLCTYRAVGQSITYDEACTYLQFVSGTWAHVFTEYTANNHVLFTLLAKVSTTVFGVTELTLRLPTLVGATLYLASAVSLCSRFLPSRVARIGGFALLSLNPFVLDFLVAARGYGLALGLLLAALVALGAAFERSPGAPRRTWLATASVALGLAVTVNLSFAFAAASVGAATSLVLLLEESRTAWSSLLWLAAPGITVSAALLTMPLLHAHRSDFFYGASSLGESVSSLVSASLQHHRNALVNPDGFAVGVLKALVLALLPAAAALLAMQVRRSLLVVRWASGGEATQALRAVIMASTLLAPLMAAVAHATAGVPYPMERTGLYLIPLFTLAITDIAANRGAGEAWPRVATGLLGVVLTTYIAQLNVTNFRTWWFDGSSRELFAVARDAQAADGCPALLATSWLYEPSLRFYAELNRNGCRLDVVHAWRPGTGGYDVYVLGPGEEMPSAGLAVRFVDPASGATVALDRGRARDEQNEHEHIVQVAGDWG